MRPHSPSLMVPTPGCWACDDMGAAFAGVFCGVLVGCLLVFGTFMVGGGCGRRRSVARVKIAWRGEKTYGAVMESIFLLRIGSDILAVALGCRYASGNC